MPEHLSEAAAHGFIDAYITNSSDSGHHAASEALAHILRSAYGSGLVHGAEDLRNKLLAEIQANGPIDEQTLTNFTSALFGVYTKKG